jgi:uncharacterized protein YkwD
MKNLKSLADGKFYFHFKHLRLPTSVLHLTFWMVLLTASSAGQLPGANLTAASYLHPGKAIESNYSLERRVFDLVNNERVGNGRGMLVWSDQVAAIARFHSNDMAENSYFSHEDRQGNRLIKRADHLGLSNWRDIGENISWLTGFEDPVRRAVEGWMNSAGHRENILNPSYRESGIGVAVSTDGKYYFTQIFVRRK